MELLDCILTRRSGRDYTDDSIPEDILNKILEAGLLAPSSRNLKSTELITISGKSDLLELARVKSAGAAMLKNAACAIVVIGDTVLSDAWIEDGSIAMTNMMLRAADLGIANCWVQCRNRNSSVESVSSEQYLKKLLNIPEQYGVLAILSLGIAGKKSEPHVPEDADFAKVHSNQY